MEQFLDALSNEREQQQQLSDDDLDQLRILCRDENNTRALFEHKGAFKGLCRLKQLNAQKTLANILYYLEEARQAAAEGELFTAIIRDLGKSVKCNDESDYVQLRLLFLITIEMEGARKTLMQGYDALLEFNVERTDELGKLGTVEVLRIIYNVTRVEIAKNDALGAFILRCLVVRGDVGEIVGNSFNVLLNSTGSLLAATTTTAAGFDSSTVVDILLRALSTVVDAPEYISASCLSLAQLVDSDAKVRHCMRSRILPSNFDRGVSVVQCPGLKAKLARLLSSPDEQVSLAVGDFLYALLDRRVVRLAYHFGYGLIAGFLYARNLTDTLPSALREHQLGDSSDEERINRGVLNNVDLVTGSVLSDQAAGLDMTVEEREAESKKLLDLFERLEANGALQVYTAERASDNKRKDQ